MLGKTCLKISNAGSPQNAISHVERLEDFCKSFDLASERGTARNAIRIVLRMVGFERSTTIAFMTEEECVVILRILYDARDWEKFIS